MPSVSTGRLLAIPPLAALTVACADASRAAGDDGGTRTPANPDAPAADTSTGPIDAATEGPGSVPSYPRGSYAMWPARTPLSPAVIANNGIVGILLAVAWDDIEGKADETFDWTAVDARVGEAEKGGLAVALTLSASLENAPPWLLANPAVQTIGLVDTNRYHKSFCKEQKLPVFWDPTFHAQRLDFVRRAGARYAGKPAVAALMTSFANTHTGDWSVPHFVGMLGCPTGKLPLDQVKQWRDAGYTTEKMLTVGKQVLDATAEAFPTQALKLPIAQTHDDLDGNRWALAASAIAYADSRPYAARFFVQINRIHTGSPLATDPAVDAATMADRGNDLYLFGMIKRHDGRGLQMLSAASLADKDGCRQNDGKSPCPPVDVLKKSVDIAMSYAPRFFEYWQGDSVDPALAAILTDATVRMGGMPRGP